MADDDRLLELLEQALALEPAEPSPERVAAVRLLAEQSEDLASRPAGQGLASRPAGQGLASRPAGRGLASRPAGRDHRRQWTYRGGWAAAGVSVAAAAVVIAMLVLPTLVGSGHDTTSANPGTPPSVARLRVALSSGNALAVARADADLLREAKTIADPEQNDAVAAHVEAIQFLRAHPSAAAAAALPPPPTIPPAREPAPPSTTLAPGGNPARGPETPSPDAPPPVPVPTTLADGPPSVAIVAIVVRLDGTFDVDFTVSGFTPDASRAPGTHSLRFSFDGGQSPTTWDGPSPWSFPLGAGVTYRQVCVHVADSAGVEDLSTGGCHDIV